MRMVSLIYSSELEEECEGSGIFLKKELVKNHQTFF